MGTAPTSHPTRFHLVRHFSLSSLVAIAGAALLLAWLYGWQAERALLAQGEQKNLMQLQLMINQWSDAERERIAALLARDNAPSADSPEVEAIAQHFADLTAGTAIRKLKIYTRDGLTVFSSERRQIGERKTGYEGLVSALRGMPYSQLSFRSRFEAFGATISDVYLIGSYLPLRNGAGEIDGVVEIYDDVTPLALAIRDTRWRIVGLTVGAMLLLYLALLGVVRRAARIQQRNHALELEVAERARVTCETQAALAAAEAARQEAERARAAADSANRAKSAFLAAMSHEIRTPLNGVIGMTEVLLAGALTEQQRHRLQIVHNSAQSLLRLLSDLLDYSRLEADAVRLQPTPFSPAGLIRELLASAQPRAQSIGLVLGCRITPAVPQQIVADEVRLRQIISNLLGNALKFTHSGSVTLELDGDPASDRHLICRVRDTGIGIRAEHLERIFRPFEQVDGTMTRRYGGAGLKLSICRRLVELMDGRIGVDSVEGKGSAFWFTFRFEPAVHSVESAVGSADEGVLLGANVLVVEDDAVNQLVAHEILGHLGCSVTVATSGNQAIEVLKNASFDAVLMDLHMDGIDGAEATRRIRAAEARNGSVQIAIVGLTADVYPTTRESCLAAGMNDVLAKPYSRQDLCAALRRLLPAAPPGTDRERPAAAPVTAKDPSARAQTVAASRECPLPAALQPPAAS